ncbi:MAG: hypothetical protein DRI23_10135 [Candidatus Cloacimonadota bacterium]|nr:MAG: hypothetical protein DRI23_10135 [Candidatus Cloacimonadota bacterium]HHE40093.1 hypothetical protein [Candidatus Cloacimonadota bacterium]
MKSVERIDIKKRWPIPSYVKFVLMLAVIAGFWGHSCWKKNVGANIQISEIEVMQATMTSADISFYVASRADIPLKKSLLIKLTNVNDELVASRITQIEIPPKTRKKYLKVLQKFERPLNGFEDIGEVTIEVYK